MQNRVKFKVVCLYTSTPSQSIDQVLHANTVDSVYAFCVIIISLLQSTDGWVHSKNWIEIFIQKMERRRGLNNGNVFSR